MNLLWGYRLGWGGRAIFKLVKIGKKFPLIVVPDEHTPWEVYTHIRVIGKLVFGAPAAMPGGVPNHVVWALAVLPIHAYGSVITPPIPAPFALIVRTSPGPGIHCARPKVLKREAGHNPLAGHGAIGVWHTTERGGVLAKGRKADAISVGRGGVGAGGGVEVDSCYDISRVKGGCKGKEAG